MADYSLHEYLGYNLIPAGTIYGDICNIEISQQFAADFNLTCQIFGQHLAIDIVIKLTLSFRLRYF